MTPSLSDVFAELGISQYLNVFYDQGFDTWETILDITESDLDALNVKLGHRRKLQRRIANARGLAPDASLATSSHTGLEERKRDDEKLSSEKDGPRNSPAPVATKRKYRRHPKPDENAPERPPSAYVLFSNKMRDDLRGRNLTFTEIAKLVGENWQSLSPAEKEPFETAAHTAKDKYNAEMTEYKKTPEYHAYNMYLQDFKTKHSGQFQDKDASKRLKLSSENSNGSMSTDLSRSTSGSANEPQYPRDDPSGRLPRVDSLASPPEASSQTPSILHNPSISPSLIQPDSITEPSPVMSESPREFSGQPSLADPIWPDTHRSNSMAGRRNLPSLSDMFEGRGAMTGFPSSESAFISGSSRGSTYQSSSPGPPSLIHGPPSLKKDESSSGSISSGQSGSTFPRTPIEGPLPIHALLTNNQPSHEASTMPHLQGLSFSPEVKAPSLPPPLPQDRSLSDPTLNSVAPLPPRVPVYYATPVGGHGPEPMLSSARFSKQLPLSKVKEEPGLDGFNALLRARDIVERQDK